MLSITRQDKILEIIRNNKQVVTQELEEKLDVSGATIRKDLKELEDEGFIKRIHGGAVLAGNDIQMNTYIDFHYRSNKNVELKKAIGKECGKLVKENQTYFLDASSTVLYAIPHFNNKENITIITNGLYTALEVKEVCDINVIVTGGIVRPKSGALEGLLGEDLLSKVKADIMITSAHGFNLEEGLTDFNFYEVQLKKKMIKRSDKLVALVDSSKIGNSSMTKFAGISEIDILITDNKNSKEEIKEIENAGIKVIIADI